MRTAVLTVTYPAAEPFWQDFITSLHRQSDQEFELLIVNDGGSFATAAEEGLVTRIRNDSGTAAYLRKVGIEWARASGFDVVVFSDADDWFDTERVKIAKESLESADLYANDLVLFGETIDEPFSLLSKRLRDGLITAIDLQESNFMGLSNTSARLHNVCDVARSIPDSQIAFDWALFAACVIKGDQALYSGKTSTYYRQHSSNIAGLSRYDVPNLVRGVKIKAQHYALLRDVSPWYAKAAVGFQDLESRLHADVAFRNLYCERVREHAGSNYLLWWEHIRLESEL